MLPIAVLPAAALLLRFGQGDLLDLPFMASAGAAIFDNLGILFAVGIAVGFAKENNGAAGLAGVVGYFVIIKGASVLLATPPGMADAAAKAAFLATEASRMSIPVGILAGLTAGMLYNRFYAIKLPDYLAFFGGRRFVPIAAGFFCLGWALVFGQGWPLLSAGLDRCSQLLSASGQIGLFLYGALNRLLIITGLHHILNNVVWFLHGSFSLMQDGAAMIVTGDLNRFLRGDPTAGAFMAGFFPVMMFGLPAACLAMYRNALPAKKRAAGGLLLSMALTAFLTGITEPVEFAFIFLAPALYAFHAVLTGLAMVIMNALDVKLGFGFSAGFIDYAINFSKSTRPLLLLPVGAAYFAVYYCLFSLCIQKFNLATPGREPTVAETGADSPADMAQTGLPRESPPAERAEERNEAAVFEAFAGDEKSKQMVLALGGPSNLISVDACATRLRLVVADGRRVDEDRLKQLGALGVIRPDDVSVQVVLGPAADTVSTAIRSLLLDWKKTEEGGASR